MGFPLPSSCSLQPAVSSLGQSRQQGQPLTHVQPALDFRELTVDTKIRPGIIGGCDENVADVFGCARGR